MLASIWDVLLLSVAVFVVAKFMPGITSKGFGTAVMVAIVYSLLNFLLFQILFFLSLPAVLFSFGLFIFIINAILLWLTDKLIDNFKIAGFGVTIVAAFLITLLHWMLRGIF